MNAFASRHAIIIGGGASGVLSAYQLLQRSTPDFRITLIEKRPEVGRGLAYHTGNPEHVLNVRVANMSALPDEPDHFWRWLASREDVPPPCPDPYCFVPRRIYGDYIASLLMTSKGRSSHRLSIVQGTCVGVSEEPGEVSVRLDDGRGYIGDIAVLATGHDVRSCSPGYARPCVLPSAARAAACLQAPLPRTRARLVGRASPSHGAGSGSAHHGGAVCRTFDRDGGESGRHRTQRGRRPDPLPPARSKRNPQHAGRCHRRLHGDSERSPRLGQSGCPQPIRAGPGAG